MLIPCDEVNILNTFRVMIILRQLLLLTNLHLKLLSTQGTGADKLLSTQRVKVLDYIKDCFKYLFIPHTISPWNAIPAGVDMPQFKTQIKSVDLRHGSTQY